MGTAEDTEGSLFLITGREHCCLAAQSRQFYRAGACRWLCRGAALEEESLPHPHLFLLPLFPPLKRLEEIIAEDLCAILRILLGCELLNNGSTGEMRQNFLALVIKEKHVSIVWGQRMYQDLRDSENSVREGGSWIQYAQDRTFRGLSLSE